MYSQGQRRDRRDFLLPEHYSGVAFDRARPLAVHEPVACAEGLPGKAVEQSAQVDVPTVPEKNSPPPRESEPGGLFDGIGQEELLLLGIIFLLAQRPGEDDTILLLLLLLLRRKGSAA